MLATTCLAAHALRPNMRISRVSKIASGSVSKGVIGSASRMSTSESVPELEFEAVVAADARRLYTLALSILRDEGEAEDAVQETLLKAWRSRPSTLGERSTSRGG